MAEDKQELLQHYDGLRKQLLTAIDGLSDEQLTEKTLDGWSIKDHLAHIATWDEIRAAEVVRISAGHESAWKMTSEQDDGFNELSYQIRRELPLAQARWEFETSRKKLLDAIAAAPPRALDGSLYGAAGLRSSHEEEHAMWITNWRTAKG
ncbi:hypothetical protein AYO38_00780 [bacterium SCGC AG-212-C10]|nr:hypothetical protein AYO38_00780 [bacterium SCGC AG-212-C10]